MLKSLAFAVLLFAQSDSNQVILRVQRVDDNKIVWAESFFNPLLELRQIEGLPLDRTDKVLNCTWSIGVLSHTDHNDNRIEINCDGREFLLQGIDLNWERK